MEKNKKFSRASLLLVFGLFATVFVLINSQQFLIAAVVYIGIALVSLSLYKQWSGFGRKGRLAGIDDNFIKDSLVGIVLGVGTIAIGSIIPVIGALGIPNVQSVAGTVGRFIIICVSAPIFEEIFFRDFILDFFDEKFADLPFILANGVTAMLFSFYHLTAYGESLSAASGSFLSAALMGFIFGYVRLYQKSVVGAIFYHATLNFWIGFFTLSVIIG